MAEQGLLGPDARAELATAVAGYVATARDHGASRITVIGTEPIRRAADAPAIVAEVGRVAGVPLHVLTHEEEAYLTVIGVTEGRPLDPRGPGRSTSAAGARSSASSVRTPRRAPRACGSARVD